MYFQPINAQELLQRLNQGERFADGGEIKKLKIPQTEKEKREVYKLAFGKEYDSADRKQHPLPIDIATMVAMRKLETDEGYKFYADGGTTDLKIVKNEQQENFLTSSGASDNDYAIKLAKGGVIKEEDYFLVLKGMGIKRFRVYSIDGNDVKINYSTGSSNVFVPMSMDELKWMLKNGYIKKTNEEEYWKEKYQNNFANGGMMSVSGEVDGQWVAESGSGAGMFEQGGISNVGGTTFSDIDLSVSNLNTSFRDGGMMEKSDLEGLIGLTFQLDLEGNGGSSIHKIEDIEVTPPQFREKYLTIITKDGTEDKIPMKLVDEFLNNDEIVLKDSQGVNYALTLIDLFEPKVTRTFFEEEAF
jgi:hypothetical protein